MAQRAHPRKLERPEVIWKLLESLARGERLAEALREAGVAKSTFYRECRRSDMFRALVEQAQVSGAIGREPAELALEGAVPTGAAAPDLGLPVVVAPSPVLEEPRADRAAIGALGGVTRVGRRQEPGGSRKAPSAPSESVDRPSWIRAFLLSLSTASRAGAEERAARVSRNRAPGSVAGADWALPALLLMIEALVVFTLIGNVALQMAAIAFVLVWSIAVVRASGSALGQPAPVVAEGEVEAPAEAAHNLDWLEASIGPPRITRDDPGR